MCRLNQLNTQPNTPKSDTQFITQQVEKLMTWVNFISESISFPTESMNKILFLIHSVLNIIRL